MPSKDLHERSREIGQVLKAARLRAGKSIRQASAFLGTSRERYAGFESGKVYLSLVEAEVLASYLDISEHEFFPHGLNADPQEIVVSALPGQTLHIRVNVEAKAETQSELGTGMERSDAKSGEQG